MFSLRLEGVETLKYYHVCWLRSEKVNIVSNNHGCMQKCNFCNSVGKTNLQTIAHLIQCTVLQIQFWSVKCTAATVRYAKILSISIPSHQAFSSSGKLLQWLDYMKTNHFKMLLNVFSTTYTYSNCNSISIILLLRKNLTNICSKLIKNL